MSSARPGPKHQDPGLQPERTVMSWGRTTLSLSVASLVFLRWLPHYGVGILLMVALALLVAGSIYGTQRYRYARSSLGISAEQLHADVVAIFAMSGSVLGLGVLGILVVLVF
ncbi:MAG: DUF202 domain-containing protein [Micrococcaceae bacterium]|nr:DUF202 domain-containing protein [Micrococcaceae bacterium]